MTAESTVGRHPRWRSPIPEGRRRVVVDVATAVAALAVAGRLAATVVANAPSGPSGVAGPFSAVTAGITALAAVGVALTETDPSSGVGLLFVGVFGLLSTVMEAVAGPAAVAVAAGTAAVVIARRRGLTVGPGVAVGTLLVALCVSLVAGVGGVATLRPTGSALALVGLALSPAFAATTGRSLLGGGVAAAAVVAVGLAAPFVAGAVTLAGGGVVGTPLPVVVLAAAGAVTAASAAARRREWALLAGVALLACAGVPSTLGRAVPFALGVATLTLREGRR